MDASKRGLHGDVGWDRYMGGTMGVRGGDCVFQRESGRWVVGVCDV